MYEYYAKILHIDENNVVTFRLMISGEWKSLQLKDIDLISYDGRVWRINYRK